jgi:hypothetical protein
MMLAILRKRVRTSGGRVGAVAAWQRRRLLWCLAAGLLSGVSMAGAVRCLHVGLIAMHAHLHSRSLSQYTIDVRATDLPQNYLGLARDGTSWNLVILPEHKEGATVLSMTVSLLQM